MHKSYPLDDRAICLGCVPLETPITDEVGVREYMRYLAKRGWAHELGEVYTHAHSLEWGEDAEDPTEEQLDAMDARDHECLKLGAIMSEHMMDAAMADDPVELLREQYAFMAERFRIDDEYCHGHHEAIHDSEAHWERFYAIWEYVTGWTVEGITFELEHWFLKATEPEILDCMYNISTGELQQTQINRIRKHGKPGMLQAELAHNDENGTWMDEQVTLTDICSYLDRIKMEQPEIIFWLHGLVIDQLNRDRLDSIRKTHKLD